MKLTLFELKYVKNLNAIRSRKNDTLYTSNKHKYTSRNQIDKTQRERDRMKEPLLFGKFQNNCFWMALSSAVYWAEIWIKMVLTQMIQFSFCSLRLLIKISDQLATRVYRAQLETVAIEKKMLCQNDTLLLLSSSKLSGKKNSRMFSKTDTHTVKRKRRMNGKWERKKNDKTRLDFLVI